MRGPPPPPPPAKLPKPWLLCIARLRPAIVPSGSPETGSLPPISMRSDPDPPAAAARVLRHPEEFAWAARRQVAELLGETPCGSPASLNASTARIADAVWWPCPPPLGENRVMIRSGRKVRMTAHDIGEQLLPVPDAQAFQRGSSRSRSRQRSVKNCRPPSSRRAARNSWVRITPSSSKNSGPITFWPPSPRVSER